MISLKHQGEKSNAFTFSLVYFFCLWRTLVFLFNFFFFSVFWHVSAGSPGFSVCLLQQFLLCWQTKPVGNKEGATGYSAVWVACCVAGSVKGMYWSLLFQLPPFIFTCFPPTLPKKKLVGGKVLDEYLWCLVHVIWEPYLPSLCFFLPKSCQVCCSRVFSSHASSCPWPTASCKMLIAQKWGHCPLHFIFYPPFPLKLSKDNQNSPAHTESVLLIALVYTFVSARAGRKWGEKEAEKENGGGGQPTLTLKAHQHLCHFCTIRTHALEKQNLVGEQLPTDPVQNAIRY